MATAAAVREGARGRRGLAAAALFAVSGLCILYLLLLYQVYNDPGMRDSGFAGPAEIWRNSWLVVAFIIILMVAIWTKWVPAGAQAAAPAGAGSAPVMQPSAAGRTAAPRAAADPSSRPGVPPSLAVPSVPPEQIQGGWQRYKFPAERTGGVYIDADVVVDDDARPPVDPQTPRGKYILRIRDEVARVCVRCELIDHCHGKVASLITRDDMLGNHECVPGLKKIAAARLEAMKRDQAAAAAPRASPLPSPSPPAPPATPPESVSDAAPHGPADSDGATVPFAGPAQPAADEKPPTDSS